MMDRECTHFINVLIIYIHNFRCYASSGVKLSVGPRVAPCHRTSLSSLSLCPVRPLWFSVSSSLTLPYYCFCILFLDSCLLLSSDLYLFPQFCFCPSVRSPSVLLEFNNPLGSPLSFHSPRYLWSFPGRSVLSMYFTNLLFWVWCLPRLSLLSGTQFVPFYAPYLVCARQMLRLLLQKFFCLFFFFFLVFILSEKGRDFFIKLRGATA